MAASPQALIERLNESLQCRLAPSESAWQQGHHRPFPRSALCQVPKPPKQGRQGGVDPKLHVYEPLAVNLIQGSAVLLIFENGNLVLQATALLRPKEGRHGVRCTPTVHVCSGGWEPGAKLASHPESARSPKSGTTNAKFLNKGWNNPGSPIPCGVWDTPFPESTLVY